MSYRQVPDDWIEFSDAFIQEVQIGVRAGWQYIQQDGFGESLVYTPEDGTPQAWSVRRNRILGSPLPVVVGTPTEEP
jgi:hypothetical protein